MNIYIEFYNQKGERVKTLRSHNTRSLGQKLASVNFYKAKLTVRYPELKKEYGVVPSNLGEYFNKEDLLLAFRAFTEKS